MSQNLSNYVVEQLPSRRSVLAVCAHPDDESFGLGAALSTFADQGARTSVLCFTHGEASTLGVAAYDLDEVRAGELAAAAGELEVDAVELLHYGDGHLGEVALEELGAHVRRATASSRADLLLVFDQGGITGHPDHRRASEAAIAVARALGVPVLAWALSARVAEALNHEFGGAFVGRLAQDLDYVVRVDRTRQHRAIRRHVSQATDNRVLVRRLEIQGDQEAFRWLVSPRVARTAAADVTRAAVSSPTRARRPA